MKYIDIKNTVDLFVYLSDVKENGGINKIIFHSSIKNSEINKIVVQVKKNTITSVLSYKTKDITKTYDDTRLLEIIEDYIDLESFKKISIFFGEKIQEVLFNKKWQIKVLKPIKDSNKKPSKKNLYFDKEKNQYQYIGLTHKTKNGLEVKQNSQKKVKQITEFLKYFLPEVQDINDLDIVDAGCGKGYLTFALNDYLTSNGYKHNILGIDIKYEVIKNINEVVLSCNLNKIKFENKKIMDMDNKMNVLIALHACNTATDQAIFKGIKSETELIICSPCCHQEIYPQLKTNGSLKNVIKHGIFRERTAEMITDSLRSLFLQLNGYKVKIIEFVESTHSGKNSLIIAKKHSGQVNKELIKNEIKSVKDEYQIDKFELENLLVKQF